MSDEEKTLSEAILIKKTLDEENDRYSYLGGLEFYFNILISKQEHDSIRDLVGLEKVIETTIKNNIMQKVFHEVIRSLIPVVELQRKSDKHPVRLVVVDDTALKDHSILLMHPQNHNPSALLEDFDVIESEID